MRIATSTALLVLTLLAGTPAGGQTAPTAMPQATPQEIPQPVPGAQGPAPGEQVTDPTKRTLTEDPAVRRAQDPMPTPQGNKAPAQMERETATVSQAYSRFVAAPPNLDGAPQPRPNPLAANPPTLGAQ